MVIIKKIFLLIISILVMKQVALASDVINIAFTIDNNYALANAITIDSILKHADKNDIYNFYVFEENLTSHSKKMIEKIVHKKHQNVQFIPINSSLADNTPDVYTNEACNHVKRVGMARLLIPELLPKDMDKILYLDSDLLIRSDIKELYNSDLTGYAVGMIADWWLHNYDKLNSDFCYCNSGIILIDLNYWRKNNLTDKMLQVLDQNLNFPDQDTINIVLMKKIKLLPAKWNNQIERVGAVVDNADSGIIHYLGKGKPWLFIPHNSYYKHLYLEEWIKSDLWMYQFSSIPVAIVTYYKLFIYTMLDIMDWKYGIYIDRKIFKM